MRRGKLLSPAVQLALLDGLQVQGFYADQHTDGISWLSMGVVKRSMMQCLRVFGKHTVPDDRFREAMASFESIKLKSRTEYAMAIHLLTARASQLKPIDYSEAKKLAFQAVELYSDLRKHAARSDAHCSIETESNCQHQEHRQDDHTSVQQCRSSRH